MYCSPEIRDKGQRTEVSEGKKGGGDEMNKLDRFCEMITVYLWYLPSVI